MTEQHPITPPEELVDQWSREWFAAKVKHYRQEHFIAIEAARWGADQELEACCGWLSDELAAYLRDRRRPKPPSLKEQALDALTLFSFFMSNEQREKADTIRRALEQLDD